MKKLFAILMMGMFLCGAGRAFAAETEVGPDAFDLNRATVEQLMDITNANISQEMAETIVEMAKSTPFRLPEDFLKVPGLDNHTLESINPVEHNGSLWHDPDAEMTLAPSKC